MSNLAQKYIASARARSEQFHNFGGGGYSNFVDDHQYGNFVNQPSYFNAAGAAAPMATQSSGTAVKPSLPYSIQVSSASAGAVLNFDVFGASTYLNNAQVTFDVNGNLIIGAVTISSNTAGVTYRDLLQQSAWQPFTVGSVYIQCSSPVAQILVPYTITTKDSNGTLMQIPIKPKKDPYQQQSDLLMDNTVWSLDGLSKLTFVQILPLAVLNLDFYPAANVNSGRMLNGQTPGKDYGNPGIIRSQTTVVNTTAAAPASGFAGQQIQVRNRH
jgi:hypothetical protein